MGALRWARGAWIAATATCLALACAPAVADGPRRIASVNVCADQLLLALVGRDRLAAVSAFATDPELSLKADEARGLRTTGGTAEEVLALRPDLVVFGAFSPRATREMLRRLGAPLVDLALPATLAETARQIRDLGARLGQASEANALAAPLDALELDVPARAPATRRPRALYLDRRGLVAGRGTLVDDLFRLAGFENAVTSSGFAVLDVERIVATRPDVVLTHPLPARAEDQGAALLRHPVLVAALPETRRVSVPAAATMCPTSALVDVVRALRAARERL